jgi:hypothetical protein
MAIKWTSVQNQNLLLLIVQNTKINYNTLPEKWTAKYRKLSQPCALRILLTLFGSE